MQPAHTRRPHLAFEAQRDVPRGSSLFFTVLSLFQKRNGLQRSGLQSVETHRGPVPRQEQLRQLVQVRAAQRQPRQDEGR